MSTPISVAMKIRRVCYPELKNHGEIDKRLVSLKAAQDVHNGLAPSPVGWRSRKCLFELVLLAGAYLGNGNLVQAAEQIATAVRLDDQQLDSVTAGAVTLRLDLTAFAQGPTVIASTMGTIRSADSTILLVDLDRASGQTRLLGTTPAELFFASGQAFASGLDGAQCSANVQTSGDFAYLTEANLRTAIPNPAANPTTVACSCAAFGITLGTR